MSTVKVNEVRHLSNSGTANIVLESNATTNLQATSTLGLSVTGTLTVSGVSTFNGNLVVGNATSDTMNLISTVSGFNNFSGFTGEIRMYAGNAAGDSPPAGWLYCNGDTISSTINDGGTNLGGTHYNADGKGNDYQPLFNLLKATSDWGNTSSASWGTDKVKLPDFRSRSPVGIATGAANAADARTTGTAIGAGLTSRTLGDQVGTETHVLLAAELATHTHVMTNPASATGQTISTITATQSTHAHTLSSHTHTFTGNALPDHYHGAGVDVDPMYQTNRTIASFTAGTRTATKETTTSSDTAGTPTGTIGGPSTPNTSTVSAGAITVAGGALGGETHTHSTTAANTGSNTAHTILSPIIAVNYIIKV